MIKLFLTATIERAIQYYLRLDPQTLEQLSALSGKVIHINIKDWDISLYILPSPKGIRLQNEYDNIPDVRITGNLFAFISHTTSKENFNLPKDLEIIGDTMLAQKFSDIISTSRIDWEEIFSLFTNDSIAHQTGNLFKHLKQFKQHALQNIQENMTDYLQEEKRLTPPKQEVEDFFEDIHHLKNDVDRLKIKFDHIQQKMTQSS